MKGYLILALFAVLGTALAAPSLGLDYSVSPSSINAGGTAQVIVTIANADLTTDITDLKIELTSRVSGITVLSGYANPGDLPAGSTSSASFTIKAIQSASPGAYVVEAKGTYEYGTGTTSTFRISIPVTVAYRSNLEIFAPDVQITPGATGNMLISLNNAGTSPIRNLVITLSPTSSSLYPIGNVRNSIEVMQPKTSDEVGFQIRASDVATKGIQPMTLAVTYTDAAGSTQTDTQSIGVTVVDAGTEVVIDGIESDLEPGKTGTVRIGIKNVGSVDLQNLYFSIASGAELSISGSNEKLMDSLKVGETGYVEFNFEVSQDSEAKPIASTLSVKYQRNGGKMQITDTKTLGIVVNGKVQLEVITVSANKADGQIEIDVANYGNKNADAIKIEVLEGDKVFGTGFTDTIKPNKHKVFRFDMPMSRDIVIKMSYKDYGTEGGETSVTHNYTFSESDLVRNGGDGTGMLVFVAIVVLLLLWWLRKRGKDKVKIDVSKYK